MALAICVGGVLVFRNAITMGVLIAYISIIKKLIEPLSVGCTFTDCLGICFESV